MAEFLVVRERGPNWQATRSMVQQVGWPAHAAFMNDLVDEGFVRLGGPAGDGQQVVLVVSADDEAEIRRRFEADPWTPMGLLPIKTIKPWRIMLGRF